MDFDDNSIPDELLNLDIRKFNSGKDSDEKIIYFNATDIDFNDPDWRSDFDVLWIATFFLYGELEVSEEYEHLYSEELQDILDKTASFIELKHTF